MKRTVSVSIGSMPFVVDNDAYEFMKRYLAEIEVRLGDDDEEVLDDVERRIADIFKEQMTIAAQVVNMEMVKRAVSIIGRAEEFGEPRRSAPTQAQGPDDKRRLYRSRSECVIGGVCGGVADYFDLDLTLVRVLTFFLVFFGGISLWVYIVLWIVLPREPLPEEHTDGKSRRKWSIYK